MKRLVISFLCIVIVSFFISFRVKNDNAAEITIFFEHYVGGKILQLDNSVYINSYAQSFTITKLKYYIGNIKLVNANGSVVHFKDYYLVNEEEESSKKIPLKDIPKGEYTGIEFIIGVDSADNCSGLQSGALDPVHAMFWAWNTGYVFLKLEGKAAAATPGNLFEYHIGGYRQPYNCIRHIALKFNTPLVINSERTRSVHIKTDAGKILNGSTCIDFKKLADVTDYHNATTIADNYAEMFSILAIQ